MINDLYIIIVVVVNVLPYVFVLWGEAKADNGTSIETFSLYITLLSIRKMCSN